MDNQELEKRLEAIEERNFRVEADKAWETSWLRRALIVLCTYLIIGIYMSIIHTDRPWINALVPVLGFILSTLTVQGVKQWWLNQHSHRVRATGGSERVEE